MINEEGCENKQAGAERNQQMGSKPGRSAMNLTFQADQPTQQCRNKQPDNHLIGKIMHHAFLLRLKGQRQMYRHFFSGITAPNYQRHTKASGTCDGISSQFNRRENAIQVVIRFTG